jgi:hypothetical protein
VFLDFYYLLANNFFENILGNPMTHQLPPLLSTSVLVVLFVSMAAGVGVGDTLRGRIGDDANELDLGRKE